jgi:hypothetical protein
LRHSCHGPANPIDGRLSSTRRNKAIAPYGPLGSFNFSEGGKAMKTDNITAAAYTEAHRKALEAIKSKIRDEGRRSIN